MFFKKFFDRLAADRAADRRMFMEVIDNMTRLAEKQTDVQLENAKTMQGFLKMFDYSTAPQGWVVREEDELLDEMQRRREYEQKVLDLTEKV